MHILVFSHYYPPEVNAPASRISENCRAWVKAGHQVTVVTAVPSHPHGIAYPGYENRGMQVEVVDGVTVIRLWTYIAANQGFARRTLGYLSYLASVIAALPRLPAADVVVSTSPQFFCGLAGWFARGRKRPRWVLEIRDIWPESIVTVGAMRKGVVIRLLEALESFAYRQADRIVAVTDSFVPHIAERCGAPEKIAVIKNGVDLTFFGTAKGPDFKADAGLEGRFVAAYVGTHGMAQGLETVVRAAERLRDDPRIAFLLVGDGAERERIRQMADDLDLPNLMMIGQLPKSEMPRVWAATDASLIVLRRTDTFTKVLPSKMFEAMGMRRPIVLGVEGEAYELLTAAGAGIAVTPEDADQLADAVKALADDPGLARRLGENGRRHVEAHFDRNTLAMRYLDLLAETAGVDLAETGSVDIVITEAETPGAQAA